MNKKAGASNEALAFLYDGSKIGYDMGESRKWRKLQCVNSQ
jgi:hypothetical protein